jgi:transcription elongation factor Elf1
MCNDVIHTHFNCPACHRKEASTSAYHDLIEWFEDGDDEFICEECGTEFKIISIEKMKVTLEYESSDS